VLELLLAHFEKVHKGTLLTEEAISTLRNRYLAAVSYDDDRIKALKASNELPEPIPYVKILTGGYQCSYRPCSRIYASESSWRAHKSIAKHLCEDVTALSCPKYQKVFSDRVHSFCIKLVGSAPAASVVAGEDTDWLDRKLAEQEVKMKWYIVLLACVYSLNFA
jgi:hypothetical protein